MSSIFKDMPNCNVSHIEIAFILKPQPRDIVIDLRHPEERNTDPLRLLKNQCLQIPFFNLPLILGTLDPLERYLLYCDRGIMSRLQAINMRNEGFKSVGLLVINQQ